MEKEMEFAENDNAKRSKCHLSKKQMTVFKTIFFLACLSGFLYQAYQFLGFYYAYPTVIEHRTETPDKMMAPAITYCYVRSVTKNNFCKLFPNDCYKLHKGETHCKMFPEYCEEGMEIPFWNGTNITTKFYLEDLKHLGPEILNTLYQPPFGIPSDEIVGPNFFASWFSLNIFTCYTLHSRVDSNKEPLEVVLNLSRAKIEPSSRFYVGYMGFALQNKAAMDPKTMMGLTIDIHSPYTNTFPHMKNLLKPETRYEIEMKVQKEYLLPHPYKTDCANYTTLWEENNRKGPRSRRMCRDRCQMVKDEACFGCVDIRNLYPYTGKKCVNGIGKGTELNCNASLVKEYAECVAGCKRECSNTKYKFSITKMKKDPWDYRGYHTGGVIEIDLFMDPDFLILSHRPQYQDIELFSYLGGYIGIWLGVSLYAISDIIKNTFVIMTPCLWKTHKKVRASFKGRSSDNADKKL